MKRIGIKFHFTDDTFISFCTDIRDRKKLEESLLNNAQWVFIKEYDWDINLNLVKFIAYEDVDSVVIRNNDNVDRDLL